MSNNPPVHRKLSPSLEDYLEAVYELVRTRKVARIRDISRKLDVKSSSATGAMQALASRGLVNYAPYDVVTLTKRGEEAAKQVSRRHRVLLRFLTRILGIARQEAEPCACGMEHSVSDRIVDRLERLTSQLEKMNFPPMEE